MATTSPAPTTVVPVETPIAEPKKAAKRPRKEAAPKAPAVEGAEATDAPAENDGSMFVVAKTVRTYLKEHQCHTGADVIPQINVLVKDLIDAGIRRATANQRKTLKSADL